MEWRGDGGEPDGNAGDATPAAAPGTTGLEGVALSPGSPLSTLVEAVDALLTHGVAPASGADAAGVVKVLEHVGRRVHAAQLEAMHHIDSRRLHRTDGHASAKVQVRHVGRLSNAEACNRQKTMRMFRALPVIAAAFRAGSLGIAQVQLLARVHANPRVSAAMELRQERFIEQARSLDYAAFEVRVREWERLIDEDGPEPEGERTHRRRCARMTEDPIDLSWELVAKLAAMQGVTISEIWGHYIDAEWQADWEKAVAEHGDAACAAHMARTDAQRRADALWQVFQDAAGADGSAVPPTFTHNIVWSADTFEEMVRRFSGETPEPHDPDTFRCDTIDGSPLHPTEVMAAAVDSPALHSFRRLVIGADGVTLDMGRKRRFTGPLADAIRIQAGTRCVWPGCSVPVSRCQLDHIHDYAKGGCTDAAGGDPLCGSHNRVKQGGYTVWRDPGGEWHILRPDKVRIE